MRSAKIILYAMLCMFPSIVLAQSSVWTNEPAGSTALLDCPFSSAPKLCGIVDVYSSSFQDTDFAAPVSPPGVLRSTIYAGNSSGGMQIGINFPQTYREMYVGLMWRTNPQFEGRTVVNKLFFVRGPNYNGFFGMDGGPAQGQSNFYLMFGHNTSGLDNSHTCGGGGLICYPNVGSGVLVRGTWTKLEAYIKASTTATSRDGIVRWWVNGALAGNYTNMNYSPTGLNDWTWSETWDGFVKPVPTVDWSHYLDHLHISIPNCGSAGCGGPIPPPPSPTPPSPTPPPPSPTPPPPSGTPGTVSDLSVVPLSSTTARVIFTQQDDGTGVPAKYDNRLAVSPISWGAASSVTVGPCSSPYAPAGIIGSPVSCDLSGLTPGQAYQMQNVAFRGTMNAGATYGSLGNIASFTMPSSNVPTITNFSPASGQAGTSITITGTNFGATIGANTVKCNGQTATITAASPTSLTFTAPDGVTTGKISVQTDQGIVYSEQNFTVGAPSNGCGCS